MPVVTFIIQRLTLGILAGMTFLGIVSEETYFATEDFFIVPQERKEAIVESLADPETIIVFENLEEDLTIKAQTVPSSPNDTLQDEMLLQDELNNLIEQNIPTSTEDLFILPAQVLREEAKDQGVGIPDNLSTQKPIPEEEFKKQQQEELQETLEMIDQQLDTLKQQQKVVQDEETLVASEQVEEVVIPNTLVNAVINIVCLEKKGTTLSIAVGSGVFVSNQGVIITNGHVAQHILRQQSEFIDCEVKHADNPSMRYRVAVVHIPDMWRGGRLLNETFGTGENDFALLQVVGPAPDGIIPNRFPFIPIETNEKALTIGNDIFLAGYPAVQTGNIERDTNASLVTGFSVIEDVFTFGNDAIDVVASGVSPVARQGSSGGAIVDSDSLIGIIVTTNTKPSGGVYLNGLTLNYIERELAQQGLSLSSFY